jgi:ArsR family transcriptional regulator, arsenate/arsenite/antimonite-responsive transcriptional repressor
MSNYEGAGLGVVHPVCCTPLQAEPIRAGRARDLAALLHVLGDPGRLRLLSLIAAHEHGSACVCDLTGAFTVTASTLSHHLKVLFDAGLVTRRRDASWMRYQVAPEIPPLLAALTEVQVPATLVSASGDHVADGR